MSNTTHESRQSGDKRRRRNRGGKNRNHQGNQFQSGNRREDGREGKPPRAEEFRPQSGRKSRPMPPPPKLTWWQKLLKAIGLYKEPVRPPRHKPPVNTQDSQGMAPKSNVRNARSGNADVSNTPSAAEPRERKPRPPREDRRDGERKPRGGNPDTVESTRVYVGNLSYEVSEEDLRELFAGVGKVRNVEIVYNRNTHRSKGYGFVEMIHINEARQAVEVLNDQFFMGRKMVVSGAQSKGQDERDEPEEPREQRPIVVVSAKPVVETVTHETTHSLVPEAGESTPPACQSSNAESVPSTGSAQHQADSQRETQGEPVLVSQTTSSVPVVDAEPLESPASSVRDIPAPQSAASPPATALAAADADARTPDATPQGLAPDESPTGEDSRSATHSATA